MQNDTISLTDAALRLQVRYRRALDMLLTGQLSGEKRDGRWIVSEESVRRIEKTRRGFAPSAA